MEEEAWFLETSKKYVNSDIFAARSWLLTAKTIFPQSFQLQIEEYMLELNKKNTEECSKVLNEIFRDFSNEPALWEEIEKLIQAVEHSTDLLRKAIFDNLPAITQQRMLIASAECRVNIAQYCRLLIVLMKKFPEAVSEYGMAMSDKLVESEKKSSEGTPVNHYRKLLVCEVLPVICNSGCLNVSHKHFYKWLQKATEFYVCFFTSENETNSSNAWIDLEKLRTSVGAQCSWSKNEDPNRLFSLPERMTNIRELFRRSRIDVDGVVNRKEIFYTTLIILFEAACTYMLLLCPSIYRDTGKPPDSFLLTVDIDENSEGTEQLPVRKSSEINEAFQVAKEAWSILHAIETFEKDFNHLLKRWKCDRWLWFQLFLSHVSLYNGKLESAALRLRQIQQRFDEESVRLDVKIQTYCSLAMTCFALGLNKESCQAVFESLPLTSENQQVKVSSSGEHATSIKQFPLGPKFACPLQSDPIQISSNLTIIRPVQSNVLSYWSTIFMRSLLQINPSLVDDVILGQILVLSQHNWPLWREQSQRVFDQIESKKKFMYDLFSDYVINIDILEEIAYLKNNKSCKFTISNRNSKAHVTRGANREADDDFWKAIHKNVQRSGENVDYLIVQFLTLNKDRILKSLEKLEQ